MFIKNHPRLFFLNHPSYLGTARHGKTQTREWTIPFIRIQYPPVLCLWLCHSWDVQFFPQSSSAYSREKKVPNCAYFSRESGWFPSGTVLISSSFQENLCFFMNRVRFLAWMQFVKKKKSLFHTQKTKGWVPMSLSPKVSPWVPHEQSPWEFPAGAGSRAGPCVELEACLAMCGASPASSATRHNLVMGAAWPPPPLPPPHEK